MKKKSVVFLLLMLVFLVGGCTKKVVIEDKKVIESIKAKQNDIPTIFLHGYDGTEKTMRTMIEQLETDDMSKEEMIIYVSGSGELSIEKKPEDGFKKNNPTIRLIFEDNTNNRWNQAEWLKNALTYLKENYQVNQVNLVGFSMGGTSSFTYLVNYSGEQTQPQINKVVTMGAPFNGFIENDGQSVESILSDGPKEIGEELDNYYSLSERIPAGIKFLLIAGELSEDDQSDGTVPLSSALGVYSLLKELDEEVSYKIVSGAGGKHSSLRVNEEVSKDILSFLWD